jgi:hypothetical protein
METLLMWDSNWSNVENDVAFQGLECRKAPKLAFQGLEGNKAELVPGSFPSPQRLKPVFPAGVEDGQAPPNIERHFGNSKLLGGDPPQLFLGEGLWRAALHELATICGRAHGRVLL